MPVRRRRTREHPPRCFGPKASIHPHYRTSAAASLHLLPKVFFFSPCTARPHSWRTLSDRAAVTMLADLGKGRPTTARHGAAIGCLPPDGVSPKPHACRGGEAPGMGERLTPGTARSCTKSRGRPVTDAGISSPRTMLFRHGLQVENVLAVHYDHVGTATWC